MGSPSLSYDLERQICVSGKLFLVVADTADLVTDLRVESLLLEGLVLAGSRPPVGGQPRRKRCRSITSLLFGSKSARAAGAYAYKAAHQQKKKGTRRCSLASMSMAKKSLDERLVLAEEGVQRAREFVQRQTELIDTFQREGEAVGPEVSTLEWLQQLLQMRIANRDRLRRQLGKH